MLGWVLRAGGAAASGFGLFAASEGVARWVRWLHVAGPGWGLDHRVSPDTFEAFAAALVGSLAAFLALFFTTLGVVAATAYADVPEQLRTVFLRERQNTAYVNTVVRALVFGTTLLTAHAVGYHPYAATVVVFAVLCLLSVLGSAALGVGLFNFFDLAKLAAPLPKRFLDAAARAAVSSRGLPPSEQQQNAHEDAATMLRLRRDVLQLITERGGTRTTAPAALYATLEMWSRYAECKPAIPTDSAWFARSRMETNWLTLNPFEARDPLAPSSAGVQIAPDLLWAERELAEHYITLLRPVVQGEDWQIAMDTVTPTAELVGYLVADLQVHEALLLCQAASAVIDHASEDRDAPKVRGDTAPDRIQRQRLRTAAVQAGLVVRGHMWQGVAVAAQRVADPEVGDRLEYAAHAPNHPSVTATLPISRDLRALLDAMAVGFTLEREAAGSEISPGWWVRHFAARSLTWSLHTTADELLEDLHAYLPARHVAIAGLDDAEALVTLLLGALDTVRLAEFALGHIDQAVARLATLRRDVASDEPWPVWNPDRSALTARRTELLCALGPATVRLPGRPRLGDDPDLLGRAYLVIADALFHAVMDGDDATAATLFPAVMTTALRAHRRTTADLGDRSSISHLIHAAAPLIDIMLISGYTLFLHAVDGGGIWPTVREAWDAYTERPGLVRGLAGILEERHNEVPVDMRRQHWEQRFERWLTERGPEFTRRRPGQEHHSPVVRAALHQGSLRTYLMADLFLLEYLVTRPGAEELKPGLHVRRLRDALAQERGQDNDD